MWGIVPPASFVKSIHFAPANFHFAPVQFVTDSDFFSLGHPLEPLEGNDGLVFFTVVTVMWDGANCAGFEKILSKDMVAGRGDGEACKEGSTPVSYK